MRGVVTLAAASGIPLMTVDGQPFPERATIQAIAFAVSVGTLLLQGWTLPLLIRWLRPVDSRPTAPPTDAEDPQGRTDRARRGRRCAGPVRRRTAGRPRRRDAGQHHGRRSPGIHRTPTRCLTRSHTHCGEVFSALYRDVLAAQRAALIAERDAGRIEDEAARAMWNDSTSGGRRVGAPGKPVLEAEARSRRSRRRRSRHRPNRRRRRPSRRRPAAAVVTAAVIAAAVTAAAVFAAAVLPPPSWPVTALAVAALETLLVAAAVHAREHRVEQQHRAQPHAPATNAGFHHGSEYQPAGTGRPATRPPG